MPSIQVIDIGNTAIKRCIVTESGEIGQVTHFETKNIDAAAGEIAKFGLDAAISCVSSGADEVLKTALRNTGRKLIFEVTPAVNTPVRGFYSGMGADRIADAAAAFKMFEGLGRPVAVIGMGTGTAITAMDDSGLFIGGYTTLGLGSTCQAITSALPSLPPIDPIMANSLEPGTNVYDALCKGTVLGHVGLIEKWIAELRKRLGSDLAVVATGGWSQLINSHTDAIEVLDGQLTIRGIWTLAMNASKS